MSIDWVAQLTYTAPGLTPQDIATLTEALDDGGATYQAETGVLQITLEVTADSLNDAFEAATFKTQHLTRLLKPTRLYMLPAADFLAGGPLPGLDTTDLVGMTEVGRILGVSRQRANTLSQTEPDFPKPARPGPRALYSRASIEAFDKRWKATRNPRGGPRPRKGPAQIVQQMQGKPTQVAQPMSGDDHTTTDR